MDIAIPSRNLSRSSGLATQVQQVRLKIEDVHISFGSTKVLQGINLEIEPGEFFSFLGPSGSGKSTLLRAMVFQNYALWPHLTVQKNVAFGLEERKTPKAEMGERIEEALEGFTELIKPQFKKDKVELKFEVEEDLPLIFGDRIQFEEILMNFVMNSAHALRFEDDKSVLVKIFKKDERTIRLECSDKGYGIPAKIIEDIFLSSVTTKGSSEGTGLGLYRVRKIVDLFKGKVWAESEGKGKGSTFIVELPVFDGNMEETLRDNIEENQQGKENSSEEL